MGGIVCAVVEAAVVVICEQVDGAYNYKLEMSHHDCWAIGGCPGALLSSDFALGESAVGRQKER